MAVSQAAMLRPTFRSFWHQHLNMAKKKCMKKKKGSQIRSGGCQQCSLFIFLPRYLIYLLLFWLSLFKYFQTFWNPICHLLSYFVNRYIPDLITQHLKYKRLIARPPHPLKSAGLDDLSIFLLVHLFTKQDVTADGSRVHPGLLGSIAQLTTDCQNPLFLRQLSQDWAQQRGLKKR